ncbi:MAG: hypothetical protein LBV00_04140, partial [Propionibacteriaceae bacterium]|nr:hypothetical protein [Propionibacteriaceae bacterium]
MTTFSLVMLNAAIAYGWRSALRWRTQRTLLADIVLFLLIWLSSMFAWLLVPMLFIPWQARYPHLTDGEGLGILLKHTILTAVVL